MLRSCKILATLLVTVFATVASPQDPIASLTPEDLTRGKRIFVGHCALCHGIDGSGGRGPSLNQPSLRRVEGNVALFRLIKNGVEGGEMPAAWQLTDREVWQLAGYVRSLGRTAPVRIPGDPARGKEVYETKGGCAACHIVRGKGGSLGPDLSEIGARRSAAYLREALLDPAASAPEGLLVVTAVTRDGGQVRGLRASEDSFSIQLRDARNRYYSFRKSELSGLKKEFGASLMPGYRTALTASEIDDLVAYLAGLRGEQ